MTFTAFDKAIVAAIIAPLFSLITAYLNGGDFDTKTIIVAVLAALGAGLAVYAKGNKPA